MLLSPFSVPLLMIRSLPLPSVMGALAPGCVPWIVPSLPIVVWAEPLTKMPWLIVAPARLVTANEPAPFFRMPELMVPLLLTLSLPLLLKVSIWLMTFEFDTAWMRSPSRSGRY